MARRSTVFPFQPDPSPPAALVVLLGDIEENTRPSADWKITRISAPTPGAGLSHVFTTGTRRFSMKPDDLLPSAFRVAKTAPLLSTDYFTIPVGVELDEADLLLPAGFTIHFSCSSISVIEVKEWF